MHEHANTHAKFMTGNLALYITNHYQVEMPRSSSDKFCFYYLSLSLGCLPGNHMWRVRMNKKKRKSERSNNVISYTTTPRIIYKRNTKEFWADPCTYCAPSRPVDLHRCVITTIIILLWRRIIVLFSCDDTLTVFLCFERPLCQRCCPVFLSLVNNAQESWTHTLRLPAQGRVDAIGARGCQALVRTSRSVLSTCLAAVVCGFAGGAMDVVGQANLVALCILFLHTFVSACGHGQNRPASPYSQRMRICSISAVVPLVIGAFAVVLRAKKKIS